MDLGLLFTLYGIHSPSGREKKMRKYIRKLAYSFGAEDVYSDKAGNLYVRKGKSDTYPCVCAHMDQVQDAHSKDFRCYVNGDVVFAFSGNSGEQQGLGADDKNGIFVALMCLKKFDVMKCAFFVKEELGCVGSSNAEMDFFKDCRFAIQADRRNGSDLITDINGRMCSDEFLNDIHYKDFGYKPTYGLITDVGELSDNGIGISCINMSCGYYKPHTDNEYTRLSELENCMNFAFHIIENCTKVYPCENAGYVDLGNHGYYRGWYDYPAKKEKSESKQNGVCSGLGLFQGKDDDYYDYFASDYDDDVTEMFNIVSENYPISFSEIMSCYADRFRTDDFDILQAVYDDVIAEMMSYQQDDIDSMIH